MDNACHSKRVGRSLSAGWLAGWLAGGRWSPCCLSQVDSVEQGKGGLLGKRITHRYPQKLAGGEGAAGGILQDVTPDLR
ncbi:hypothetical protein TEQG_08296 [Trichophyton equinum CBS 127.97]|uniref:Uncharacterized protein n=1 Tax=Trichophyton equinum (strain ATCC MYA-4606 / CBS 127.97) TaxID=559882 RepID=F2Q5H7_TRIEC|nr:hypothetical protein TEQG_08296 [Trichophyton equinum CBS 127.97]